MNSFSVLKWCFLCIILMLAGSAFAYETEEDKPVCKKPKFTDFSLPEYNVTTNNQQVNPESEFFFKLPADVDPSSITLTGKNRPLEFSVESTSSFHKVTSKLPASLTGYFVRLDAYAKSVLGCDNHHGWLIKISGHEIHPVPEQ